MEKEEPEQMSLDKPESSPKSEFSCKVCDLRFDSQGNLNLHTKDKHHDNSNIKVLDEKPRRIFGMQLNLKLKEKTEESVDAKTKVDLQDRNWAAEFGYGKKPTSRPQFRASDLFSKMKMKFELPDSNVKDKAPATKDENTQELSFRKRGFKGKFYQNCVINDPFGQSHQCFFLKFVLY